ncbi:MAG: PQQ-binding-like beta-propeller repeat protein [Armatimonadetes bacterium]|nr:PQQ-binding-like beta-propeller repeat protein [Armatimonadota bacterium]
MKTGLKLWTALLGWSLAAVAAPTELWQQKIDGYADKPTVADLNGDNRLEVVVATDKGTVLALAGANGAELWSLPTSVERFLNAPLIADVDGDQTTEVIVLGNRYGTKLCINGEDGSSLWQKAGTGEGIPGQATVSALTPNGPMRLLYVTDNELNCLDAATGDELWKVSLGKSDGAVTVGDLDGGDREILVGTNDGRLVCLDSAGQQKWQANVGGRSVKPALTVDLDNDGQTEVLAVGSGLVRLDASGKVRWTWSPRSGRGLSSSLAVHDLNGSGAKQIVVAGYDGGMYAVNANGKEAWRFTVVPSNLKFVPGSTPALVDVNGDRGSDLLFASPRSDDPRFFAVNGKNGQQLWTVQTTMFSQCCPVVADIDTDGTTEVVFCVPDGAGAKGWLTALKLNCRNAAGWMKFAGDLGSTGNFASAMRDAATLAVGRSPFPVSEQTVTWIDKVGPAPERLPGGPVADRPTTVTPPPLVPGGRPASGIAVMLNEQWLLLDPAPQMVRGSVLVPLRGIFEALQTEVKFEPATKVITANRAGTEIVLKLGSSQATVGGRPVTLSVPAQAIKGSTYVPLRFIAEALGAAVEWDAAGRNVKITSP